MTIAYPTIDEQATPEYVLAVLRDRSNFNLWCEPSTELTFETTVDEWTEVEDTPSLKGLGQSLNEMFRLQYSWIEWKTVLEPREEKNLYNVCEFVARKAVRPRIREARLLGRPCLPGGAFLTIRSILAEAGADAESIGPSSDLAPFTRRYYRVFIEKISRLSPGVLPKIHFHTPVANALGMTLLLGVCLLLMGAVVESWNPLMLPVLMLLGLIFTLPSLLLLVIVSLCFYPSSVQFGNLRTFRDLAIALTSKKVLDPEL